MFENDAIYDQFKVAVSHDGATMASGSYNGCFHLVEQDGTNIQYEVNYSKGTEAKRPSTVKGLLGKVDYARKTGVVDFNPRRNALAAAVGNCFFIYTM